MFSSPFTATRWQVTTYLLGVALFSISFLVFLNSSISFVITDLIGRKHRVGDAVGTLGFADELIALIACPFWGLLSDRLGVRTVCILGYTILGISFFAFVQAENVYPQLLLGRLFYSIGGAANATMVTAMLPTMTLPRKEQNLRPHIFQIPDAWDSPPEDADSRPSIPDPTSNLRSSNSQVAGFVGLFTGLGALLALTLFLPLPARLQRSGLSPATAITDSFYIVGSVAFIVAIACAIGLRNLPGEQAKGWRSITGQSKEQQLVLGNLIPAPTVSYIQLIVDATKLGFTDTDIGLGYLGGFVARTSSVCITTFIPLFVNAYFISSGLCKGDPVNLPEEVKQQCRKAYVVAAQLSGSSQLIALVFAPIFGYLGGRFSLSNTPLLGAALSGIIGYTAFAQLKSPEPSGEHGGPAVFFIMALLGISQIGAIVISLSLLSRGIQKDDLSSLAMCSNGAESNNSGRNEDCDRDGEHSSLLSSSSHREQKAISRRRLKGSIAGMYSFAGGAGILLLTKGGGFLFDEISPGAPFYMLAIFNALLLFVGSCVSLTGKVGNLN